MKTCTKCNETKLLEDFSKLHLNKDGHHTQCKKCLQKYRTQHYFRSEDYRQKRIKKATVNSRKRKYGISEDQFQVLLESQNYCCAICSIHLDNSKFSLRGQLDHCHKEGTIRGVLCGQCNTALGLFKDNKNILLEAISYLDRF